MTLPCLKVRFRDPAQSRVLHRQLSCADSSEESRPVQDASMPLAPPCEGPRRARYSGVKFRESLTGFPLPDFGFAHFRTRIKHAGEDFNVEASIVETHLALIENFAALYQILM